MNEKIKKVRDFLKEQGPTFGSATVGATAGVAVGGAITPDPIYAELTPEPDPTPAPEPADEPTSQHPSLHKPDPAKPEPINPEHSQPEPPKPEPVTHEPTQSESPAQPTTESVTPEPPQSECSTSVPLTPEDEIEVLAYERLSDEDGRQMDIAVVREVGEEVAYIDINIDGTADFRYHDANDDGEIQEAEIEVLTDQNISMITMQDAVGFDPLLAQNDLPDFVNDANVDSFMA